MSFDVSEEEIRVCLDELGAEYFRVGAEKCKHLTDESQLAAILKVGIRAVSLCYGFPVLLDAKCTDSYDVTRRAFLEAYYLMNELKLKDSSRKAYEWHKGKADSWSTNPKRWEHTVLVEGDPIFGREYGDFSEIAHPTVSAANESAGVLATRLGIDENAENFQQHVEKVKVDLALTLMRLIHTTFVKHPDCIDIPVSTLNLTHCDALLRRFNEYVKALREQDQRKSGSTETSK